MEEARPPGASADLRTTPPDTHTSGPSGLVQAASQGDVAQGLRAWSVHWGPPPLAQGARGCSRTGVGGARPCVGLCGRK